MMLVDCETDRSLASAGYSAESTCYRSSQERECEYATALSRLRVTVCVVQDESGQCTTYVPPEHDFVGLDDETISVSRDMSSLLARLDAADVLCAWNGRFDISVLSNYVIADHRRQCIRDWSAKMFDPMLQVYRITGGRYASLSSVARLNSDSVGTDEENVKLADGMQAIQWYEQGEWLKLAKYCAQDVRILRRLVRLPSLKVPIVLQPRVGLQHKSTQAVSCQPPLWMQTN